jgi:hypothetical protein
VTLWQIRTFPKCRHHVFLSHCQEDHDGLVRPVYDALVAAKVVPWLDKEDYNYGRSSREALQGAVLASRHVIFFVTDAMLRSARGWCVLELAYAEILDANLQGRGGSLAHAFLPLFLTEQADERLPRTVWQAVRDRGHFLPTTSTASTHQWCVQEIKKFLLSEQQVCRDLNASCVQDAGLKAELQRTPGLYDRVTKFEPRRLR